VAHRIRQAVQSDAPFLSDMLVEAFDWTASHARSRVELLGDPAVSRYIRGWRRPGDGGVVALDDHGAPLGACWYRVLGPATGTGARRSRVTAVAVGPERDAGYGWVGPGVPELTLGVRPIHRAKGVGRALLVAACAEAARAGHQRISLSVERTNFAWRLYLGEGFVVAGSGTDSDTMVKTLR
jgi:GNAT superfamily N-acetyltransferase